MFKKLLSCDCASKHADKAYAFMRIVLGSIFVYHGWLKHTMGMQAVTDMFMNAGVPWAAGFAYIVTYGEIIAGILLIIGVYTHWAAKFTAAVALGAIFFVHWQNGFNVFNGGYEFHLMVLAVSVYILARGDGACSGIKCFKR